MPLIQVPQNVMPRQIEIDDGIERSKPGALYFTPGSTKTITKDELEFLKKNHKDFARKLTVLPFDETKGRLAREKAKHPKIITRPKDKKSKAKQRAEKLLLDAKNPNKSKTIEVPKEVEALKDIPSVSNANKSNKGKK